MVPCLSSIIFVLFFGIFVTETEQGDAERRLLSYLFDNYEALERPVLNDSEALEVQFSLTLQQIIDVDEKYQVLHSNLWLNMCWEDYRLVWNPSNFSNITMINMPIGEIWRPDVLMYNSADETFDGTFPTNAIINSDGFIKWVPPGMFKSTCNINIQWFPFDDQQCELKFGSWTYDGTKLNLTLMSDSGDISAFIKNGEWTLLGMPAVLRTDYYECCPNMPFPSVTYYLKMRRGKLFIITNFFAPATLLTALSIASFVLPVGSSERVSFGMPGRRNVKYYEPDLDVPWIDVAFVIAIRRRPLYYTFNLILPSIILSCITLLTFTLPVESGEKISLGVTILLSLTVFLLLVAETLPPTSDAIPLIGFYFAATMMMCSLSVVFTVVVLNFHSRRPETHEMPDWVKRGVCEWLAWLLRMERPGHDLSRKGLISRAKQIYQLSSERSSRSLISNVIEIDEDIRVMVNGFRSRGFGLLAPSASNDRVCELEMYTVEPRRRQNSPTSYTGAKSELVAILTEMRKITNKLRADEAKDAEASDWQFAAMVIDRLCLYVFIISTLVSTSAILLSAPNIFI